MGTMLRCTIRGRRGAQPASRSIRRRRAISSICARASRHSTSGAWSSRRSKMGEDVGLSPALDGDDEGNAEFGLVGVVQGREPRPFVGAQGVEADAGLLAGRIRRQPFGLRQPPGEVGMGENETALSVRRRERRRPPSSHRAARRRRHARRSAPNDTRRRRSAACARRRRRTGRRKPHGSWPRA